jgi:hypothetical protein
MALTQEDFGLSDEQLQEINQYFEMRARQVAESGDHIYCPTLNVRFSFTPVFGRSVHIAYDSEITDRQIECQWSDSP